MHSTAKFRHESQDPSSPAYGNRPLSSTITNLTPEAPDPPPAENTAPSRPEMWLNRIFVGSFVLMCMIIGFMLIILPWTKYWTQNTLLLHNLSLREFAVNDFVRGAVSGLGLVDIWMGFREGTGSPQTR